MKVKNKSKLIGTIIMFFIIFASIQPTKISVADNERMNQAIIPFDEDEMSLLPWLVKCLKMMNI